jgi:ubiquinol-cytochrome c reductase cytochrome c1 subunit
MRKALFALVALVVVFLIVVFGWGHKRPAPGAAGAVHETAEPKLPKQVWSFDGPFGTYDRAAAQRGYQVYDEVCSRCHAMNQLHYRDLVGLGYNEEEVKAIAAQKQVGDGPNDQGEMFQRPGRPYDKFVAPFANDNLARVALNGALPPDLSLIIKAREGGADYLVALLLGYKDKPPAGVTLSDNMMYNDYFPGHQLGMPPPLSGDDVKYGDGTKPTLRQEAIDVATFLTWAAEPTMEERKRTGAKVIIFLLAMTGVLYAAKRQVWAKVH